MHKSHNNIVAYAKKKYLTVTIISFYNPLSVDRLRTNVCKSETQTLQVKHF